MLFKLIQYSVIKINLNFLPLFLLHVLFAMLFASFYSFSIQFRCILLLSVLEATGKAGQNVLKVVILFLILTGSIRNTVQNSKEVARAFSCTTYLTYNLTKTKFDLIYMPFLHAFSKVDINEVQTNLQQITDVIFPIIQEVEGETPIEW